MTNTKYPNLTKKNTSRPQHTTQTRYIRRPRPTKSEAGERNPKT
ncbi:unnamed protein product [Brassica rapa]|uniref:Uncharacterized protein n=1 Tax=Brassica campestris TaxID=3711 RepID=A0A8D9G155_BRACM|nr:unnamed protein product [Brassica rapa]